MTSLAHRYRAIPPAVLEQIRLHGDVGAVAREAIGEALGERTSSKRRKLRRPSKPEKEVRRECNAWLRAHGAFVIELEQGYRPEQCRECGAKLGRGAASSMVTLGAPDAIALWPDSGCWMIEYKRSDGGKLSEHQLKVQAACKVAGVVYVVARGVEDLETANA